MFLCDGNVCACFSPGTGKGDSCEGNGTAGKTAFSETQEITS